MKYTIVTGVRPKSLSTVTYFTIAPMATKEENSSTKPTMMAKKAPLVERDFLL